MSFWHLENQVKICTKYLGKRSSTVQTPFSLKSAMWTKDKYRRLPVYNYPEEQIQFLEKIQNISLQTIMINVEAPGEASSPLKLSIQLLKILSCLVYTSN
jgi:hypothetical protein